MNWNPWKDRNLLLAEISAQRSMLAGSASDVVRLEKRVRELESNLAVQERASNDHVLDAQEWRKKYEEAVAAPGTKCPSCSFGGYMPGKPIMDWGYPERVIGRVSQCANCRHEFVVYQGEVRPVKWMEDARKEAERAKNLSEDRRAELMESRKLFDSDMRWRG
jgi:hypothetical protein